MKHSGSLEDVHILPEMLTVLSDTLQNFLAFRRSKKASPERALCGKCGQISVCLEGWQVGHCPHGCNYGFGEGCAEMGYGGQGQRDCQALNCVSLCYKIP